MPARLDTTLSKFVFQKLKRTTSDFCEELIVPDGLSCADDLPFCSFIRSFVRPAEISLDILWTTGNFSCFVHSKKPKRTSNSSVRSKKFPMVSPYHINAQPTTMFSVRVHFGSCSEYSLFFFFVFRDLVLQQIQAHNTTAKEKKKKAYVYTKASTFHDRSLFCSVKISQPVSCNIPGTWYEVLLSVLPLVSSTATTAHIN